MSQCGTETDNLQCCVASRVHVHQRCYICRFPLEQQEIRTGVNTPASFILHNMPESCSLGTKHFTYHSNHLFTLLIQLNAELLLYFHALFLLTISLWVRPFTTSQDWPWRKTKLLVINIYHIPRVGQYGSIYTSC